MLTAHKVFIDSYYIFDISAFSFFLLPKVDRRMGPSYKCVITYVPKAFESVGIF
jgi:hypothetical protein